MSRNFRLSPSFIISGFGCRLAQFYKYVKDIKPPTNVNSDRGDIIHSYVEDLVKVLNTHEDCLEKALAVNEYKNPEKEDVLSIYHRDMPTLLKNIISAEFAREGCQVVSEQLFKADFSYGAFTRKAHVKADIIVYTPDGDVEIYDFKTKKTKKYIPSPAEIFDNIQLNLYALIFLRERHDEEIVTLGQCIISLTGEYTIVKTAKSLGDIRKYFVETIVPLHLEGEEILNKEEDEIIPDISKCLDSYGDHCYFLTSGQCRMCRDA